jgi:hypothetical protein
MTVLLYIIIVSVWIVGLFLLSAYTLFHKILIPYKLTVSETSFQELLIALNAAIQTEFDLFDKNVFIDKTAITNSNFDNYYYELTDHIIKSLSPLFYKKMTQFITEDAIYTIIGRKVKEYLTGKINGAV